jgi:hypothetical protein
MCNLTRSIPASCGKSVPGVRKIWLARKANAVTYTYANDDFSYISFILNSAGNPTPYYEFEGDLDFNASLEELDQTANGRSFPQSFTLRFAEMAKEKRAVLESMIYDQLSCVYLDRNGRYWLLGQENGLKATGYQGTSDTGGGGNRYVVTLTGRERFLQREVNGANFIYTSPNGGQGQTNVTPWIKNLGGSGPNGGITTILNTWEVPAQFPRMPLSQLGNQPLIEVMQ